MNMTEPTEEPSGASLPQPLPASMSCDVAIVGYGPVGMIIGVMLAQRGYAVVVVERWPTRYDLPRAGHFDSETMRTFQGLGFAESIELMARPMLQCDFVTAEREVLTQIKLRLGGSGCKESYLTMTDPEQAHQRDEMLRSGQVPKAPVLPRIGDGIVRSPDAPDHHETDGPPSRQARVAVGSHIDRLDEVMKQGWKIVARHPLPLSLFNHRQQQLIADLDLEFAHVSRGANAQYIDTDGEYDMWYAKRAERPFFSVRTTTFSARCVPSKSFPDSSTK